MSMDREFEQRVGRIAEQALEVPDPELSAFLDRACEGDEELRAAVEALLDCMEGGDESVLSEGLQEFIAKARLDQTPELDTLTDDVITKVPYDELVDHLATPSEGTATRYSLRGEVGRGGMAAVLRVWDENLHRPLAMKVILGEGQAHRTGATPPTDSKLRRRFLEEAHVTGRLDHPGIVPVHELGVDDQGRVYFTMKLVKGRTLDHVFEDVADGIDGWTQARAVGLILRICEAVAYAHDKGVIHRDLKPTNVMVGRFGEVYVMDWGLARILSGDEVDAAVDSEPKTWATTSNGSGADGQASHLTHDGDVLGTPAYMPLEQASGDRAAVGRHSDVYSVGAMLYHLIVGRPPYVKAGEKPLPHVVVQRVLAGPPDSLERASDVAPELVAVCERAMARDWKARYASMQELADDLQAFVDGRVVSAHATGAWPETKKWVARNRALAGALGAVILSLAAGLVETGRLNASLQAREAALETKTKQATALAEEAQLNARVAEDAALEAKENEERAEAALQRAEGLRLAALAESKIDSDPELALLLAIESAKQLPGHDANVLLDRCLGVAGLLAEYEQSEGAYRRFARSKNGHWLVAAEHSGFVGVWNRPGELHRGFHVGGGVDTLAIDDASELLAVLTDDGSATVWSLENGRRLGRYTMPDWPLRMWFEPGTNTLVLRNRNAYRRAWDVGSGREVEPPASRRVTALGETWIARKNAWFSDEGGKAVVGEWSAPVALLDARTGDVIRKLEFGRGDLRLGGFSSSGAYLGLLAGRNTVFVLDTATGEILAELPTFDHPNWGGFDFDEKWLIVYAGQRPTIVTIWDWASGSPWMSWELPGENWFFTSARESTSLIIGQDGYSIREHPLDPLAAALRLAPREFWAFEREQYKTVAGGGDR